MIVDLNSDLGEGIGRDADIMPLITSANVACGFHAGNAATMSATVQLAKLHQVVVGGHPGHRDPDHFGRRELPVEPAQVFADCIAQIDALRQLADQQQVAVKYLKPHGGLYHQANREEAYADAVVEAAGARGLAVIGLPASKLERRSRGRCPFVAEGFADRRYQVDGSLVPRDQSEPFIDNAAEAVAQVKRLLDLFGVRTICVHGDNPQALIFVQSLRAALLAAGFEIRSFA